LIFRIAKRRKFAQIDNRALEDPRLSLEATGLLAYLLSKPDNWQVRKADMVRRARGNYRTVRRATRVLVQLGYARLGPARGEDGKLAGTAYVIYERPRAESIKNRGSATSTLGCTDARFLPLLSNTDPSSNTEGLSNSNIQRTSNTQPTCSRCREVFASLVEILPKRELEKNSRSGKNWRKRITYCWRAVAYAIEDYKVRTPDQRSKIKNVGAWLTDRYQRALVEIDAAKRNR
jgi:hypothetical protein